MSAATTAGPTGTRPARSFVPTLIMGHVADHTLDLLGRPPRYRHETRG